MPIKINQTIKQWNLFQGLSDTDIKNIIDTSTQRSFKSGQNLCVQGEEGKSMFIICSGKVNMQLTKPNGSKKNLNLLKQGDHFGEMSILSGGTRTATAVAITDSDVLELTKLELDQLINEIPALSLNLSRTISSWLQGELIGKAVRKKLHVLGLVRTTSDTSLFATQIVEWFSSKAKQVAVFTDRLEHWRNSGFPQLPLVAIDSEEYDQASLRLEIIKAAETHDHVFLDIDENQSAILLSQCERIWWLVNQKQIDNDALFGSLKKLLDAEPLLRKRTQLVVTQVNPSKLVLAQTEKIELELDDLNCQCDVSGKTLLRRDLSRFYHLALGVHMGMALGGGGARSCAHLGVMVALEENDLYFDRIAGTSGGAIAAAFYAMGFEKQHMIDVTVNNLTTPKLMKKIPGGTKWFLLLLHRFDKVQKICDSIFNGATFEQMLLPTHLVCADLISGHEVVRSNGDVSDSVVASMNVPILGRPINIDGKSLVDGGILNNVPSSVLRANHTDYVLSVHVGGKLSQKFGDSNAMTPTSDMKQVGVMSALFRVLEVAQNSLEKRYEEESDFVILPDTSAFAFEDFSKAEQLCEIGYDEAMKVMPELKASYNDFIEQA